MSEAAERFNQLDYLRLLYGEPRTLHDSDGTTGWRLSHLDSSGRINLIGADGLFRAYRCTEKPRGSWWSPDLFGGHPPPHPRCVCGFRVLLHLKDLWRYWRHQWRIHEAAGRGWEDTYGTADWVLLRVEALGPITGGTQDDPLDTRRAGLLKPIEAYLPPWVDAERFAWKNPHSLKPQPMSDLPAPLEWFAPMRSPEPPVTTLRAQSLKHHLRVVTGVGEVLVPRSHVQPDRVLTAIWDTVHGINTNEAGQELIDRLVIPLTDLDDPEERLGCAEGLAYGLALLAEAERD